MHWPRNFESDPPDSDDTFMARVLAAAFSGPAFKAEPDLSRLFQPQ